ncbi:MAG TPA: HAD family hydrolase [Thermomicrobiaceae bacterium]|nr:HAD family hydrolase [Thermomicrobiaceae bacterium]
MIDTIGRSGQRPRLVLFDLDDTLCDHDGSLRLRLRLAFASACRDLPGIDLDAAVAAAVERSVAGTEHFGDVLAARGVRDPERVERAVAHYAADRYRGLRLFDESLDVVETIKRQARVGMITNGPSEIQRNKIRRLEIGELFPFVLVSEEVGSWKPDTAIFHRALELGQASPAEAVYVGDSPEHDVAGARAAGLRSVWVNRGGRTWPGGPAPDFEVRDLRDLLPLLGFDASPLAS